MIIWINIIMIKILFNIIFSYLVEMFNLCTKIKQIVVVMIYVKTEIKF